MPLGEKNQLAIICLYILNWFQHNKRKEVFGSNLELIEKHNIEEALGLHTFSLGINEFADLTDDEFSIRYNGLKGYKGSQSDIEDFKPVSDLPKTVDWIAKVLQTSGWLSKISSAQKNSLLISRAQ